MYALFSITSPKLSTSEKSKASFSAISKINSPSFPLKNSPFSFNNLSAFHCLGLWEAVNIIPPSAFSRGTAISTVGVVDKPKSITSIPSPTNVFITKLCIIGPEILASLPITTFNRSLLLEACLIFKNEP